MSEHKFPYRWTLKDANFTKDKGKVFSCFSCCGGSTMGYKLAGFDVIGCNEIDPKIIDVYKANHHPKYAFLESIETFKDRDDLPDELYHLDILDGSPPCSTFSLAGLRDKAWGKMKKFREGQAEQVLDQLFFHFIDLAKKLQPKVVIAENVKGMLIGDAIKYVEQIHKEFNEAGYYCQHFLLDGTTMGLPQKRQRVFFLCLRKDLAGPFLKPISLFEVMPFIDMKFNEEVIPYKEFETDDGPIIFPSYKKYWEQRIPGERSLADAVLRLENKVKFFNATYCFPDEPVNTVTAHANSNIVYDTGRFLSDTEVKLASSFPLDFDNNGFKDSTYFCGMSVPPIMMANVASRVWEHWLSKLNEN